MKQINIAKTPISNNVMHLYGIRVTKTNPLLLTCPFSSPKINMPPSATAHVGIAPYKTDPGIQQKKAQNIVREHRHFSNIACLVKSRTNASWIFSLTVSTSKNSKRRKAERFIFLGAPEPEIFTLALVRRGIIIIYNNSLVALTLKWRLKTRLKTCLCLAGRAEFLAVRRDALPWLLRIFSRIELRLTN
jgi:hypothetical protein